MTNFRIERDAILQKWYGLNKSARGRRPAGPIKQSDYLGVRVQVNLPFRPWGCCLVWKYALNKDGYGTLTRAQDELAHRQAFIEAHGQIPEGQQINHLCNRPYCVQPSHLYAGNPQDNADDRRIFNDPESFYKLMAWHFHPDADFHDPEMKRLRDSDRLETAEPWEPPDQPPQEPLIEFECPGHDFQIRMQGNKYKICRICEIFEGRLQTEDQNQQSFILVRDFCPVSQTVDPIFQKILESEFTKESQAKFREKAYNRSGRTSGPHHDIRVCPCRFCLQDRTDFRKLLQPLLTNQESLILDSCDVFAPKAKQIILDGTKDALELCVKGAELTPLQIETIRAHCDECLNSRNQDYARGLEMTLAHTLHAMTQYNTMEELTEGPAFRRFSSPYEMFEGPWRMTKWDVEQTEKLTDIIQTTCEKMITAAHQAAQEFTNSLYDPQKPNIHQQIWEISSIFIQVQVIEHMRYEFTGRNSSEQMSPAPHADCIQNILETDKANPCPDFLRSP